MHSTRIVLTGTTGLVGSAIQEQASAFKDLKIIPWFRTANPFPGEHVVADLTEEEHWLPQLTATKPDVLIHSAAQSHVDCCSADLSACRAINVEATKKLVRACNEIGTHIVFISSDFIFDGQAYVCHEESPGNPVNRYGKTKLEAEALVKAFANSWSIVRTIMVYGVTSTLKRNNILTWVVNSLQQEREISVVNDQFRMPTFCNDLARGVLKIAQQKNRGVFHLSGLERISVYEFARRIARHYGFNESLIHPVSSARLNEANPRPPSTAFSLFKSKAILNYEPSSLEESLSSIPLARITSLNL